MKATHGARLFRAQYTRFSGDSRRSNVVACRRCDVDARLTRRYMQELGLKPVFLHAFPTESDGDAVARRPWRVATVDRGWCRVLGFDDREQLIARRVQLPEVPIAVGDWVVLDDDARDPARIDAVLDRTSCLERGSSHQSGSVQLIAANIDTVFIVAAFADTQKLEARGLRARRLDRFIAAVRQAGATPVVILNKVDLTQRDAAELATLQRELAQRLGGVEVLLVSVLEQRGLEAIEALLAPGETVAFIGASGVGKSSLVNWLLGEQAQQVHDVRARDRKGRHTTTRRELMLMPSGSVLIDTPGVREFAVVADDRMEGFDDIDALAVACKFRDCSHDTEPGCAVRASVERGALSAERLQSYRDIARDAQRLRDKHDAYARHLEHRQQRRFGKLVRSASAIKKTEG